MRTGYGQALNVATYSVFMSIRNGLLALLEGGPMYGYQLRTEFESRTGGAWPLNIGQVYTTLQRLERDRLVVPTTESADPSEGHRSYTLTDAGHAEVEGWFRTPVDRAAPPRDELAIKLAGNSTTTEVNLRDVSNYSSPTLGQTLCLNGKTTHSHCAQVRKVSVCSNGACNLVQMSIRVSEDGDSGGPWYSGNVAYGIHKGWQCDPSCPFDRSIFTRVTRLDEGLGVVVATS